MRSALVREFPRKWPMRLAFFPPRSLGWMSSRSRWKSIPVGARILAGRQNAPATRLFHLALEKGLAHKWPMLACVFSAAVHGIDAFPVEVEVNSCWGDTVVVIVGLPDAAVKESRDRVSTALSNSGFKFPMGRTTINLAPADVKKEGPSFDLPMALGMVAASDQMDSERLDDYFIIGELALTGSVRTVKGVLPIALRARAEGKKGVLVPVENAAEAAVVQGLEVIAVENLRQAVSFLEGDLVIEPTHVDLAKIFDQSYDEEVDMADVKGQEAVKRALEIAAAGGHNLLMLSLWTLWRESDGVNP